MEQNLSLRFSSSIQKICDVNESFSSGHMRVCYTGPNRNKTDISKESIEAAIPSMYNCPVVCNYSVEEDRIGSHDMDIVQTDSGDLKLINLTSAVGVVPAGAKYDWETVEEDGVEREYFSTDVVLWKRSPVYEKLISDGITGQSMEIEVKEGSLTDGIFVVDSFIFTAFCLLGDDVAPCFKSASLQMFSDESELRSEFGDMMREFKLAFSDVNSEAGDDIKEIFTEGGEGTVNEKQKLMAEYGIEEGSIEFDINAYSLEELKEKFEELKYSGDEEADAGEQEPEEGEAAEQSDDGEEPEEEPEVAEDDGDDDEKKKESYALNSNIDSELRRVVSVEKVETKWGEECRYWLVDFDVDASMVYCFDECDWLLYGFAFKVDGDSVVVDWESKRRAKYVITDFVEGQPEETTPSAFSAAYENASARIDDLMQEIEELKKFKADVEEARAEADRAEVFAQFEDLEGVDAFENLRSDCSEYSADEIAEKCYAIRGRRVAVKFSAQTPKAPKLHVPAHDEEDGAAEPYGGLFKKYNIV